jgi:hypothetical protein
MYLLLALLVCMYCTCTRDARQEYESRGLEVLAKVLAS